MFDLEKILVKGIGKKDVEQAASRASTDWKLFDELIRISLTEQDTRGMKASWIAATAAEANPQFAERHFDNICDTIGRIKISSIQRELMKVLSHCRMNEMQFGKMTELSFSLLRNLSSDIATKHHAKIFLEKACKLYPELIDEMILALEPLREIHTPAWKVQVIKTIERLNVRKTKSVK